MKRALAPSGLQDFYEKKSAGYDDHSSSIGAREKIVLDLFPPAEKMRVLDYGCGAGRFLRIVKSLGHDATGMDISENSVRTARDLGAEAFVGNAETGEGLENLTGKFDIITALDVLEHTFDPAHVIRNLLSLLREGGCVIASVPNIGCLAGRATICAGKFPSNPTGLFDSGHIRWFTRSNLENYFRGTNTKLTECRGAPLPAISKFGLWRTERFQKIVFGALARCWPSLWGYQLIFKLIPRR